MDEKQSLESVLSNFKLLLANDIHDNLSYYITCDNAVFDHILNLCSPSDITPVYISKDWEKTSSTKFLVETYITVSVLNNNKIYIKTAYLDRSWYMFMATVFDIEEYISIYVNQYQEKGYGEYMYDYNKFVKKPETSNTVYFNNLIGVDDIQDMIVNDINNYFKNINKFRQIGMNRGLNYIFHGPAGVGKTSIVKALVNHFKCDLYHINRSDIITSKIASVLNPLRINNNRQRVILFDDCNRISNDLLPELFDNSHEDIIRFFITNNYNELGPSKPFISRCKRVVEFKLPNHDNINALICSLFDLNQEQVLPLTSVIMSLKQNLVNSNNNSRENNNSGENNDESNNKIANLGYRELNQFLCEFIGCSHAIEQAISKLQSWSNDRTTTTESSGLNQCPVM